MRRPSCPAQRLYEPRFRPFVRESILSRLEELAKDGQHFGWRSGCLGLILLGERASGRPYETQGRKAERDSFHEVASSEGTATQIYSSDRSSHRNKRVESYSRDFFLISMFRRLIFCLRVESGM